MDLAALLNRKPLKRPAGGGDAPPKKRPAVGKRPSSVAAEPAQPVATPEPESKPDVSVEEDEGVHLLILI